MKETFGAEWDWQENAGKNSPAMQAVEFDADGNISAQNIDRRIVAVRIRPLAQSDWGWYFAEVSYGDSFMDFGGEDWANLKSMLTSAGCPTKWESLKEFEAIANKIDLGVEL